MKKKLAFLVVLVGLLTGRIAFAQTNAVLFKLDDETKNLLREVTADTCQNGPTFYATGKRF
jgi:hypothetical protein